MRVAMPFSYPGTLTEEEYLALTAYLARAHGVWDGRPLDIARAHELRLQPLSTADVEIHNDPANQAHLLTPTLEAGANSVTPVPARIIMNTLDFDWPVVLVIAVLLVGGIGLWLRNR